MVMATYVLINIIMALVIDVYTSIEDKMYDEKKDKKAIINFGKAAFKEENKVKKAMTINSIVKAFTMAGRSRRKKASQSEKGPAPSVKFDLNSSPESSDKEEIDKAVSPTQKTVEAGQAFKSLLKKKKGGEPKKTINESFEDED